MNTRNAVRMCTAVAILAAVSVAKAQTQPNQPPPQQTQPQQTQPQQTQPQQTQQRGAPAQKQSYWQKLKNSVQQAGQNTAQQGTSTVQQGAQGVQQGVQGVQQGTQGVQQQMVPGASQATAGMGGGGGSCGSSCFDAGLFQASVSQMTMSQQGPWHIIRLNMQFHNTTSQPLVIAYREGSMVMVDNNGNSYQGAGGNPGELQGMGIDRGNQTDSQFVLAPGQTGNAMFAVARARGNDSPVGTAYSYNLTLDELQTQNGAQAIPVRQYNLNFPALAPGSVGSAAAAIPSGSPTSNYVAGKGNAVGNSGSVAGATSANPQGVGTAVRGTVPSAATSQQVAGGRTAATPARSVPLNTPVNAALKSAAPTTANPSAVVKPIAATTKPTIPPKKPAAPTTTTTTTSK